MASSENLVLLMGNCTRDIDLKYSGSGLAIAEIGLAVNERVKRGDEWVEETLFVDCSCFGRTAENAAQYLKKGSSCYLRGRLKLDTWEKDGQKRSKLRVVVDRLQFLSGGEGRSEGQRSQRPPERGQQSQRRDVPRDDFDDVPF